MQTDKKRRNTQTRMAPGVLIVVFLLIIIWLSAGRIWKNDGDETAATDASAGQTAVGETLTAGARENLPQTPSPEEEAPDGIDPPGDPLGQEGGLPDDGAGAAVRLKSSSQAPEGEDFSLGIDVSKWQGEIDWEKVKNAGAEFVIIRMGYQTDYDGENVIDPYFVANIEGAKRVGLPVGIYYYSYAKNIKQAKEQAEWVKEQIKQYEIELPIAFDWESWNSFNKAGMSFYTINKAANVFLDTLVENGYKGLLYSSKNYLEKIWNPTKHDTWLAHYTSQTNYQGKYSIWQMCDTGRIDGINTNVDVDIMYMEE